MKKLTIMLATAFSVVMPLMAEMETVGGYTWTYRINGNTAEIRSDSQYKAAILPSPTGAVTIPSTLGGKPVTRVGDGALYNCIWMSSVTIPNGVTSIGQNAFYGCSGLPSVTIPDGVTSIGESAFHGCSGLKSVNIPNGVTSIGPYAFHSCALTGVAIPPSVKRIGICAFNGSIRTPINVYVSDLAAWCQIKIAIYDNESWYQEYPSVGIFPYNLYLNGQKVSSLKVPAEVYQIDARLFDSCMSLTSVTLPSSVQYVEYGAFNECSNLKGVTIQNASIAEDAFSGCRQLDSVTLGDGVTSIGKGAFWGCAGLKSITVPRSVDYIGQGAFDSCNKLTKITLPMWCKNTYVYHSDSEYRLTTEKIAGFEQSTWQAYLGLPAKAKITYADVSGSSGGGIVPESWQKARTLRGVAFRNDNSALLGVFELKCGKASKKGIAKVSATLTGLDGKKKSYKSQSVDVTGKDEVEINFNGLSILIDNENEAFYGEGDLNNESWFHVETAEIGGNWTLTDARVYVDVYDGNPLPEGTIEELLPIDEGESVLPKSGKWAFNKAATVKLSKDKTTVEWDTSKGKSNLSAMKLTYTPKTGLFKGSFTVYALEESKGGKKNLKKYNANVTGVVLDGVGYGQATIKKPVGGPWIVTVE